MTVRIEDIFAVIGDCGQLYCMECAHKQLDMDTISSSQIITRDEAELEEQLYFCDVHPTDNDQVI